MIKKNTKNRDLSTFLCEIFIKKVLLNNEKCPVEESVIKEAAQVFARFFAEVAVDWIRGRSGNDPVQIMENVIQNYKGVAEVVIHNIMEAHGYCE